MGITKQYEKAFNSSDQRTIDKNAVKGLSRGKSAGPSTRKAVNTHVSGNNNRK